MRGVRGICGHSRAARSRSHRPCRACRCAWSIGRAGRIRWATSGHSVRRWWDGSKGDRTRYCRAAGMAPVNRINSTQKPVESCRTPRPPSRRSASEIQRGRAGCALSIAQLAGSGGVARARRNAKCGNWRGRRAKRREEKNAERGMRNAERMQGGFRNSLRSAFSFCIPRFPTFTP